MPRWITRLFLNTIAVLFAAWLLDGIQVDGFVGALWVAIGLSLINLFIRPIFIILTIPITMVTFGIFLIFINAIMILIADSLMDSLYVENFWWAFLFGLVLGIVNSILNSMIWRQDED